MRSTLTAKLLLLTLAGVALLLLPTGCGKRGTGPEFRELHLSANGKLRTLDPAQADDLVSQHLVASFYDTLLQYDYLARPYRLAPSMLTSMPTVSPDRKTYRFQLRGDLYFQSDRCFGDNDRRVRHITTADVVFSLLRLADARVKSPVFWMLRGKIEGLDQFHAVTAAAAPDDMSMYDRSWPGLEIVDAHTLMLRLRQPDPRLLYALAMPNAAVVSRRAVTCYGEDFQEHPIGSGPFRMVSWRRDYRIILERNPEYRYETFPQAADPKDRRRTLPLSDRIVCNLVKQPLASWLMFLRGELDQGALDKDTFDAVVGENGELVDALKKRGIELIQAPAFEVTYIGFNFTDPILGHNPALRKAISLAYDVPLRMRHFSHRLIPANGPIPPGVAGYDPAFRNPYNQFNLELAKKYLAEAGYPNGIDSATGMPLELTFDQGNTTSQYRQLAELMIADLGKIGIKIKPVLNNAPQFYGKLRKGQFQLFRLSWVGDYPDGENFLQLFYGPNAGSCNRVFFRNAEFDRMFEAASTLPEGPERAERYRRMTVYLAGQCPWIFEGYTVSFTLNHDWLENYRPHDFAFAKWKYLTFDPARRQRAIKAFTPIEMDELRH